MVKSDTEAAFPSDDEEESQDIDGEKHQDEDENSANEANEDETFGIGALFDDPDAQPSPIERKQGRRENPLQVLNRKTAEGAGPKWAKKIAQDAMLALPYAVSTSLRILLLLVDLMAFVAISFPKSVGKELAKRGLVGTWQLVQNRRICPNDEPRLCLERIIQYMIYRVEARREVQTVDGKENTLRLSWGTLTQIRWDLFSILSHKASPPLSSEEMAAAGKKLRSTADHLKNQYDLNSKVTRALQIGRTALMLMIKDCITRPLSWEAALQEVTLYLVFWYLGIRPGSLLPTSSYSFYLTWKQIKVRTIYVDGTGKDKGQKVLYGFFVLITINAFRGYQHLQSLEMEYAVRPTTSKSSWKTDLGIFLMSLALRRGYVKGYTTVDELRYDGPNEIEWTDEALDQPVFLRKSEFRTCNVRMCIR